MTLPETNIELTPENLWLEDDSSFAGHWSIFKGKLAPDMFEDIWRSFFFNVERSSSRKANNSNSHLYIVDGFNPFD